MSDRRGRKEENTIENFGNTAVFNTGNYLSTGSNVFVGSGDFSIDFWLKAISFGNKWLFQLSPTGFEGNGYSLGITLNDNYIYAYANTPTAGLLYNFPTNAKPILNKWYHLAITKKDNVIKFYFNSTLVNSFINATNLDYRYLIVGGAISTIYLWHGNISNFRIFTKAIDFAETGVPLTIEDYADDVNRTFFLIGATDINSPAKAITNNGSVQVQNIPIVYP